MSGVSGKVAIVSGAARGLGEAFALRLAGEGYTVLGFDIDDAVLRLDGVQGLVADVSTRAGVEAVVEHALTLGELGVLVNNAGTWRQTPVDSSWQQALEDWDYIMDTNLKGVMMLSRAVIPHMQSAGGGHVINISTYYVLPAKSDGTNQPVTDLYNASKWALNGFTDAWAKYLAKDEIKVNALCMGAVDTPMLRAFFGGGALPERLASNLLDSTDIAQQLIDVMASGRTGENFGAWVGEPVGLGEPPPPHKRITG